MTFSWTLNDMPDLTGRRILITGANSGVGYYAAQELARRGAKVLLACRDRARGEAGLARLKTEASGAQSGAAEAELVLLDLASLESVRGVADAQLARDLPIDTLINNAGVMAPPRRRETADGFELQFGTNVLGHFALTGRLLPLVRERVVTLASIAHKRGRIDFGDLESERSYNPMRAYQQSKLADLMFAFELDSRLRAAGSRVRSIAVHPGVAETPLFKIGASRGLARVAEKVLQRSLGILFNSGAAGALPTLYAATAAEAEGGAYYGPQGFQEMRGANVGPAKVAAQALDQAAQARLWEICAELTGVSFPV